MVPSSHWELDLRRLCDQANEVMTRCSYSRAKNPSPERCWLLKIRALTPSPSHPLRWWVPTRREQPPSL